MEQSQQTSSQARSTRAEKLSIISAMLGPETLAKLRAEQPELTESSVDGTTLVDANRAAWHRNRLLERLRSDTNSKDRQLPAGRSGNVAGCTKSAISGLENQSLDVRIAKIADLVTLEREHPAIIARLVKTLSRADRVEVLKSLPGPVARSIVRRLR